ncbi:hypothetical protein SLS60_003512 [Paraconiothyrium brasiliense]|uniref:C3H1-type domain-containing protein n=1 Tax=Paraconiothyrium brasiliense TaxID=300254 RepID=A0ABR3RWB9_9PLEO
MFYHHIKETPVSSCVCIDCIMSEAWLPASALKQQPVKEDANLKNPKSPILKKGFSNAQNTTNGLVNLLLTKNTDAAPENHARWKMPSEMEVFMASFQAKMKENARAAATREHATGYSFDSRTGLVSLQANNPSEVCKYFNNGIDCTNDHCTRKHICSMCHGTGHGAHKCMVDLNAVREKVNDNLKPNTAVPVVDPQTFNSTQPSTAPGTYFGMSSRFLLTPQD